MQPPRIAIASLLLLAACASHVAQNETFDGQTMAVARKHGTLTFGDWQVSNISRSSANRMATQMGATARPGEYYRFDVAHGAWHATVQCRFETSTWGTLPGRVSASGPDETLSCNQIGSDHWLLDLNGDPLTRLSGQLRADLAYDVMGIAVENSPVSGFYIEDSGSRVAVIELQGSGRVRITNALSEDQRNVIMPAVAALLLFDEQLREI